MFGQQLYFKSILTVKMRACQKMLIGDGFTSDNAILQEKSHNFVVLHRLRRVDFHKPLCLAVSFAEPSQAVAIKNN